MTKEQAIGRCKKMIQINNGVIKEARKNGDIFTMQLTADLDTDSIAIETILSMLEEKDKQIERCINLLVTNDMLHAIECENKDKIIDLMAKVISEAYFESEDFEEWFENKICKVQMYEDYTYLEKDIKQYFENKAKELLNK